MRIQSKTKSKASNEFSLAFPDILKIARHELSRERPFRLRLCGSTMEPYLHDGDWLTFEPVHLSSLRAGDIVLAATTSQTAMVHRVLRIESRGNATFVVTRADSSTELDMPVPLSNILGRVSHIDHAGTRKDLTTFWQRLRTRLVGWRNHWQTRHLKSPR